ncbi:MAG: hypothetical protein JXO22_10815, partial [Phycisphaerae bacterium]|nr:hypothetical protein [Phycisphaerae bacterium]
MAGEAIPWTELLRTLRADYSELYRSWFEDLTPGIVERGELRITVPDSARADYLRNQCGRAFIQSAISLTGYLMTVRFVCENDGETLIRSDGTAVIRTAPLNPDYRFDQFVVGPSNRLAHAACRAVCTQPGTLYNPLFIHGASGLGKTHLLQAICAEMQEANPGARCMYVSCETFVNEFVRAIEHGELADFRNRAREANAL